MPITNPRRTKSTDLKRAQDINPSRSSSNSSDDTTLLNPRRTHIAITPTSSEVSIPNEPAYAQDKMSTHHYFKPTFPIPGTAENPIFKGEDATDFFENYEELVSNYELELTDQTFLERFASSIDRKLRPRVTQLSGYAEKDRTKFKDSFLEHFKRQDNSAVRRTKAYAIAFVERFKKSLSSDYARFCDEFQDVVYSIAIEELDENTRGSLLLSGLPRHEGKKVWERALIEANMKVVARKMPPFTQLCAVLRALYDSNGNFDETLTAFGTLLDGGLNKKVESALNEESSKTLSKRKGATDAIDRLAESFEALSLKLGHMGNDNKVQPVNAPYDQELNTSSFTDRGNYVTNVNYGQSNRYNATYGQSSNQGYGRYQNQGQYPANQQGNQTDQRYLQARSDQELVCFVCDAKDIDYHKWRDCPLLRFFKDRGMFHTQGPLLVWGPYQPGLEGGDIVKIGPEKPFFPSIIAQAEQKYGPIEFPPKYQRLLLRFDRRTIGAENSAEAPKEVIKRLDGTQEAKVNLGEILFINEEDGELEEDASDYPAEVMAARAIRPEDEGQMPDHIRGLYRVAKARAARDAHIARTKGTRLARVLAAGDTAPHEQQGSTLEDPMDTQDTLQEEEEAHNRELSRTGVRPKNAPKIGKQTFPHLVRTAVDPRAVLERIMGERTVPLSQLDLLALSPDYARMLLERCPRGDVTGITRILARNNQDIDDYAKQQQPRQKVADTTSRQPVTVGVQRVATIEDPRKDETIPSLPGYSRKDLDAVMRIFAVVPSPRVEIFLGPKRSKVMALVDEGSESNICDMKTAMEAGMILSESPNVIMRTAAGSTQFSALSNATTVVLGHVTVQVPFFVCAQDTKRDPLVILGRPWTRLTRMVGTNCDDGSWEGKISSLDGKEVMFQGHNGRDGLLEVERCTHQGKE